MKPGPGEASRDWLDIKRGARVNFFGILARSLKAGYLVVVARVFGTHVLGYFLLSTSVVDLCSKLGLFGLDRGLVRFLPRKSFLPVTPDREGITASALGLGLVVSLLTSIGLFLLAPLAATRILDQPQLTPPLRILAWSIVPMTLSSILLALTRTERHMQYEVWVRSGVEPVALLGGMLLFYGLGQRETGLYLAQLLSTFAGLGAALVFAARLKLGAPARLISVGTDWSFWRENRFLPLLASFGLPIALYDLLAMGAMRLDFLMLAPYVSARELGIYGAAAQVAFLIRKIRQAFDPIVVPVLSEQLLKNDLQSLHHSLDAVSGWISALCFGFLLVSAVYGRELLLVFGEDFGSGRAVLFLIAVGYAAEGFWGVSENVILLRKPYWNLWNWVGSVFLAVLLNLFLIPRYRLVGAAAGVALVFSLSNLIRLWQARLLVGWLPFDKDSWRIPSLSLGIGFAAWILKAAIGPPSVWFTAALAVVMLGAYGAVLYRFRPHSVN